MSNFNSSNNREDALASSSLPSRTSLYRPQSAKQSRDPSQRKSVSFNDVPIVHEVPLHDTTRTPLNEVYRSWTATDSTNLTNTCMNITAQKLHPTRLGSASSNNSQTSRVSDLTNKVKIGKLSDEITAEERGLKTTSAPIYIPTAVSLSNDHHEDKRYSYRPAIIPDNEHYRNLPFNYGPVSESATIYTNLLSSLDSSIPVAKTTRTNRARSATLPNSRLSSNETFSLTSPRSNSLSRTILKPTTIGFQTSSSNTNLNPTSKPTRISSANRINANNMKYPLSSLNSEALGPMSTTGLVKSSTNSHTRSRSANVTNARRHALSPDRSIQQNFMTTSKRNPNVRHNYGSYYMHRVLLPANIN